MRWPTPVAARGIPLAAVFIELNREVNDSGESLAADEKREKQI
jgi:hypothetical protein